MINHASFWGGAAAPYEIEQSLRFDGSAYLSRSLSTTANYTMSVWVKFAKESNTDGIIGHRSSSSAYKQIFKEGSGYDSIGSDNSGSTYAYSNDKCRDFSAWYHIVCSHSSSAKSRIWINGQEVSYRLQPGSGGTSTSSATYYIGALWNAASPFNGYMAEVQAVESTELPTAFGEYDDNGVWRPIKYSGSYGSSGYYLKFDPSATNGIGHDHSGNGNNFTPTGFTTSGTGTDVMSDTPTNNYCTFNPLNRQGSTLSNGNLNATMPGRAAGTFAVTSGKWYWECKYNSGNGYALGLGIADVDAYYPAEAFSYGVIYYGQNGSKYVLGTNSSYSSAYSGGHFGIALDLDSAQNTIEFFLNGTSKGTINIPDGRNWTPIVQGGSGSTSGSWDMFINENTWTYTPPTGFKALNTSNLPAPTVKDGSQYFNTVLWTGNATDNRAITGVGFQPSWTWIKTRSAADNHSVHDEVRGANRQLFTNSTDYEFTSTTLLKSFDSDGFTLGTDSSVNGSGRTFVAWNWLASNTSGSSNTDGSITSTVSANPSAGFSIVSYTGTQAAATVGHGLGVAPSLIITRNRDSNSVNWRVQHASLGPTKYLSLNLTDAAGTASSVWNNTAPTSTVFSIADDGGSNGSSQKMIAYCFAEVENYSKFGSFVGNGSDDGVFIYLGFKPKWLLLKSAINTADDWIIMDVDRSPYNVMNDHIVVQQSAAEVSNSTETNMDFLSNGIKLRDSNGKINASGSTYIYAAFAENPFGGSGVSPATAR